MSSKRLEILENSLQKKKERFDLAIDAHFAEVRKANGQPLNDKKNGYKTIKKWEKQNERLQELQKDIEKTEFAIDREKTILKRVENTSYPDCIQSLIDAGILTVWRKYPHTFFVDGVQKARISYKKGKLTASYFNNLEKEHFEKFKNVFNELKEQLTTSKCEVF